MTLTARGRAQVEAALRSVNLPPTVVLLIFGVEGKVRHVAGGSRDLVWCNMFHERQRRRFRTADEPGDEFLPLCGGCLRTLPAVVAREIEINYLEVVGK